MLVNELAHFGDAHEPFGGDDAEEGFGFPEFLGDGGEEAAPNEEIYDDEVDEVDDEDDLGLQELHPEAAKLA